MNEYNIKKEKTLLEQKICNIISYVLSMYHQGKISEKVKNDILRICNPDVKYNGSGKKWKRRY